jgi:hypothetical protein
MKGKPKVYTDQELIRAFYPMYKEGYKSYIAVFEGEYIKTVWADDKKEALALSREYAIRFLNKKLYSVQTGR